MIIWGGFGGSIDLNDGGRYSPATSSWTAIASNAANPARDSHTAVWTGSEMIVWGGYNYLTGTYLGDMLRYTPSSNTTSSPLYLYQKL